MKDRLLQKMKERPKEFISGEELSKYLKISRAAVWKHIKNLREEGFIIEARTHRGYRLLGGPDRLIKGDIIASGDLGQEIIFRQKVVSTNETAKELARRGSPHGTLVVAEEQTGGKGRLGRKWFSPPGKGICLTLLLRPPLPAWEVPKINLVVAVALAEALEIYPGLAVNIKWPNDIMAEGRKIAGILTEMQAETDAVVFILMGIGVNVNTAPGEFPEELKDKAGSLAACLNQTVDRKRVINEFLKQMEKWYKIFLEEGFAPVRKKWKSCSNTLGQAVTVMVSRGSIKGTALDLMPDGALLLKDSEGKIHTIHSGDIVEGAGSINEN